MRFAWRVRGFWHIPKYVAGAGVREGCKNVGRRSGFKRVRNDAFRVAGAGISCSVMSMFEASGAESVEGLQILCYGNVALQGPFRVAVTGVRMPRLNFFVAGAVLSKHPLKNR